MTAEIITPSVFRRIGAALGIVELKSSLYLGSNEIQKILMASDPSKNLIKLTEATHAMFDFDIKDGVLVGVNITYKIEK